MEVSSGISRETAMEGGPLTPIGHVSGPSNLRVSGEAILLSFQSACPSHLFLGPEGCVYMCVCQRVNAKDALAARGPKGGWPLWICSECPCTGDTKKCQSNKPGADLERSAEVRLAVEWQEPWKPNPLQCPGLPRV